MNGKQIFILTHIFRVNGLFKVQLRAVLKITLSYIFTSFRIYIYIVNLLTTYNSGLKYALFYPLPIIKLTENNILLIFALCTLYVYIYIICG